MFGFFCDTFNENMVNLIVQYYNDELVSQEEMQENNPNFFATDSIAAAMEHFGIYIKNNSLYRHTKEEKALDDIGIESSETAEFREKINNLLQDLTDEQAVENSILFPKWSANTTYSVNDKVRYNNILYKVLQAHTSQNGWEPNVAPSLFARVLTSEDPDEILPWAQPDSTNGYSIGDKVIHNEQIWISTADNNVWEPGIAGSPWELESSGETEPESEETSDVPAEWENGHVYMTGDRISFENAIYESTIDNNVWSPESYPAGWQLITE